MLRERDSHSRTIQQTRIEPSQTKPNRTKPKKTHIYVYYVWCVYLYGCCANKTKWKKIENQSFFYYYYTLAYRLRVNKTLRYKRKCYLLQCYENGAETHSFLVRSEREKEQNIFFKKIEENSSQQQAQQWIQQFFLHTNGIKEQWEKEEKKSLAANI